MKSTTFTIEIPKPKGWQPKIKQPKKLRLFSVIGRFFCKIGLHNWRFSHDTGTGINEYYECKRCKKRKVEYILDGYQPIDRDWLIAP